MASSNVCWGIEIGAAAIKAVKLEATGDNSAKLLEYAVINHPKPLSTPDINPNDVLRVSLGALTSQYDLTKASIAVSVPGHAAFARFAKLPPVEPKKVPDIVKFEAMQQIPFPLEQVEWDFQTFVSPDSPDVEVGIFAITRERVMERLQMLEDVGLTPNYVVLSPIAVYNALAYDLEFGSQTPGTIIVDVGTTSTDLVVATPGRMWVRTFPIGGHQFTDAVAQQFQLSYAKADKIKREAEDSKHARQIFQAMRPVFTDLAQDIQRSIGYYQSLNKDANLTRLIGVGSTFKLPGLRKYLKQQLSMDVYRIEEFKKVKVDGEGGAAFNDASLNLVTAYGLALQGLGLNAVGGNLMPVSVLRKSMWKEKVPLFGLAAGLALAASGAMFLFPLADKMGITSNPPDPAIARTMQLATELKGKAQEAGVLDAGGPDMNAANMISLTDKRVVYQFITADVASIFENANGRLESWLKEYPPAATAMPPTGPAFNLVRFDTDYKIPVPPVENTDPAAPVGEVVPDPLKINAFPRVECKLTVETNATEPRKFAQETVEKWLKANVKRAPVPYEIVFASPPFVVTEAGKETVAGVDPATGAEVVTGRGGALRGGAPMEFGREPEGYKRTLPAGSIVVGAGSEASNAKDASGEVAKAAARAELDKTAPMTSPPARSASGTITVTWYAVFKPAPSADQAGADAGKGGGK